MSDLRDKILSAKDLKREAVECPEWGCTVYVQSMTAGDRNEIVRRQYLNEGAMLPDHYARIVYMCACDESGTRIFSESDIPEIQKKDSEVIWRIANAATAFNNMDSTPAEQAEKNSEATPDGCSDTD